MSTEENVIHEEVVKLASDIKAKIKIDQETGVGEAEEGLYEKTLPEDLNIKVVKKVKRHDRNFIAAGAKVFGELAVEAMAKNKKLTEANIEIPMSTYDSVSYHVDRHREYTNHLAGDGSKLDKYGVLTTTYTAKGGKNSGDLKKVRVSLQELAKKKLAGK